MKAAIYARKSNDDSDRNPENKSVTRQVERARAYAVSKGWDVDDDLIFSDDGISGAEYQNRPGLARLFAALPKRGVPPFDVLVMSESSRLGRDMSRNTMYVLTLIEAGVRMHYYLTDEEEKADSPEQKIMVTLRGYASEVERLKAGQRSRDALERKAMKGYNAGGIAYGYDNIKVMATNAQNEQVKSHTDYKINEVQAEVIRRIFRAYADGHGHATIAKALNGDPDHAAIAKQYFDGARPASPRKGTGSWAPSSVRALVMNERYTGIVPFGESRKTYRGGTMIRVKAAPETVLRTERPDLRIIPDDLWRDVRARLAAVRGTYLRDTNGRLWGRPGAAKYLLTGLAACGCCGRNITMRGGRAGVPGKRRPLYYYGCASHYDRGSTICSNGLRARMEDADSLVIDHATAFLTPEAMDRAIDFGLEDLVNLRSSDADRPDRLEAELQKARRTRENFLAAVAEGNAPRSILEKINALDTEIAAKELELANMTTDDPSEFEVRQLRTAFRERLGRFDEFLHGEVPLARQALQKLILGRIQFQPEDREGEPGYRLRWSFTVKPLVGDGYLSMASPRGFEPRLPP